MTWVSIGVAAIGTGVGLGTSLSGGGSRPTSTTTSQLQFPPETRNLFQTVEYPMLQGALSEQANLLYPFMGGSANLPTLAGTQGVVQKATLQAGKANQIPNLGPAFENVYGLTPELVNALQALVLQRGAAVNTIVPPGYGQFLSPSTFSQTTAAPPNPYQTGFQLAGSAAQLAGSLFNSGVL